MEGVNVAPGVVWVAVGVRVFVDVGMRVAVGGIGVNVGPIPDTEKLHHNPLSAKIASLGFTATTCQ